MKRIICVLLTAIILMSLAGCSNTAEVIERAAPDSSTTPLQPSSDNADPQSPPGPPKIGISMPALRLQRWSQDTINTRMRITLESLGYEVDFQSANNDIDMQIGQIENMIAGGCDMLVIVPVDGHSLREVLAQAKSNDIPVISYGRLIMETDAVTYYVGFSNWRVGEVQGEFIRDALDLDNADGPFNIEFFTGDLGDSNVRFFTDSAMAVLQPYLNSGKLVCPSGQTDKLMTATSAWSAENAQARMENLIAANNYSPTGTPLHAVLCSNDYIAQGVTAALADAGFVGGEGFPIITGQDCDIASVRNMIAGRQAMSVLHDTRMLEDAVVEMVQAIVAGNEPTINDRETYDNMTGIIPAFLCDPVVVTINNYAELLIGSGYYTEGDLSAN